ncbi:MAG TPA: hypothetical protein VHS58_11625 [Acetobacteraceae bacterium]|jgi:hypothetical protein|nr:hypothetical protein [Acetobacteraceae bacterium]
MNELRVAAGHVVALRLFDVAFAIDLARAEALWSRHAAGRAARSRLSGTPPKAVAFGVAPLAIALDPIDLALEAGNVPAGVTARLYDFGAVSIALRVAVADLPWDGYVGVLNAIGRAVAPAMSAGLWQGLLGQVTTVLAAAMVRRVAKAVDEDYLVGTVQAFSESLGAADLLQRVDLVPLLSGERRPLSDGARAELLRQRFSYYPDDLVVLTWDRAFILEPRGDNDVADVLEVANAQLLEMRYYDELLDDELPRMYDLVETARRGMNVFASRRYATLARRLYTLVAEVTELTERVDNALQVTEDVYLARIYAAALELYRVPLVTAAVNRKIAIIRDTYQALYDEASSARSEVMEIAVIVLIMVEVVLALFRH